MEQFLLGYWWLILLTVIITAVILRSLIKLLTTIVVIAVIFVVFWQIFISSEFLKASQCIKDGARAYNLIYEKAKLINAGTERKQYVCTHDAVSYTRLIACFNNSRQKNKLSFMIFSNLPTYSKIINETIESHNKLCPESPLAQPTFRD